MANPYIPASDGAFASWLLNFATLIAASPTTYGLIAGDATAISAQNTAFQAAYLAATNPATRTAPTVAAKDAARLSAENVVRPYAVRISLNAAVTDLNKTAVGVTVRSVVPTPVPAPTVAPEISLVSAITGQMTLGYKTPGAAGKYKPPGVVGVEVFRAVGTVAAVDPAQASYSGVVTKSPFRQTFDAGDRGKIATIFCRYVTRSGPGGAAQAGPWSDPLPLVVM